MHKGTFFVLAGTALTVAFLATETRAQNTAAFSGKVSSPAEPVMEGVIVGAKKDGGNITVHVVSNDKGEFNFPADRLSPGRYKIFIRAIGYDLQGPKEIDIPVGGGAKAEIKLDATKNLEKQLNNAEWIMSAPGTDKQREALTSCVGCHNLQRPLLSMHDADAFQEIFARMQTYSSGSTPLNFQRLFVDGERVRVRPQEADANRPRAEFFAKINLSNGPRSYPLKTLPRPTGRATRVIYTHILEFRDTRIGRVDPETNVAKIWTVTFGQRTRPRRGRVDAQDRLWFAAFGTGHIGMFDPATEQFASYLPPTPWANPYDVEADKKAEVWAGSMLNDRLTRLNPQEGQFVDYLMPGQFTNIRRIFVDNKTERPTIWIGDNHGANIVHVEPLD